MTVTMDATMLKIERTGQDGTVTATVYKLDGSACGGALEEILRVSCNSAFAQMAAHVVPSKGRLSGA